MAEEKIYESKKIIEQAIDTSNPDNVVDLIKLVLNTSDDSKMKLYVIGEILTKNKNDVIYELKGNVNHLNKRISNQRLYINKLKKALAGCQAKVNQANAISDKIDRDAYRKACNSYDNNYSPKKKIVVRKKPYVKQ